MDYWFWKVTMIFKGIDWLLLCDTVSIWLHHVASSEPSNNPQYIIMSVVRMYCLLFILMECYSTIKYSVNPPCRQPFKGSHVYLYFHQFYPISSIWEKEAGTYPSMVNAGVHCTSTLTQLSGCIRTYIHSFQSTKNGGSQHVCMPMYTYVFDHLCCAKG